MRDLAQRDSAPNRKERPRGHTKSDDGLVFNILDAAIGCGRGNCTCFVALPEHLRAKAVMKVNPVLPEVFYVGKWRSQMVNFRGPRMVNPKGRRWLIFAEDEVEISNAEMMGTSYFGFGSAFRGGLIRSYVQVGRYTRIGRGVSLGLGNHDFNNSSVAPFFDFPPSGHGRRFAQSEPKRRVIVGNDVWIGDGARLNTGVRVGDGAVVGAAAMVTKDVPPYAIVAGVPARIIKWRFEESVRSALSNLRWWDYEPEFLRENMKQDPAETIELLNRKVDPSLIYLPKPTRLAPEVIR